MNKPELLAPCGSPEALTAAIAGGADAVYLGGTTFNARMNASNFDRDALKAACLRCHENGVKLYVTLNTQIYDRELSQVLSFASFLYEIGVDGVIVADLGLAELLHTRFPDLSLHASTQATCHSTDGARELAARGFVRMVCPREIDREALKMLCAQSPIEIEAFVHGAICVSCSGQCLLSAVMGGRSGNRGQCAQPCRLGYNGSYPISLKDLCLAKHVPSLIEAGVASFKLEGRMKSPSYVYGVTRIYRRLIDENRAATDAEMAELARLFSRSGFTDGYYTGKVDASMLGIRREADIKQTRRAEESIFPPCRPSLPPITPPTRTPVELTSQPLPRFPKASRSKPISTARFRSPEQIPQTDAFAIRYLPLNKFEGSVANGVILPPVIFDTQRAEIERRLERVIAKGAKHILISGIGQIPLAKESGLAIHGDFRFNAFNTLTARSVAQAGEMQSLILSPELILPQIRDIVLPESCRKGFLVYGRMPLMLLEKPVGCKELRDRKSARFPIFKENGRDQLYNSLPTYMADQTDRLDGVGIDERHFIFTDEDRGAVLRVVYAYSHGVLPKDPVRRIK